MSPDGYHGHGNIRVFVRWHDQTVFAGEDVKCRITFQNTTPTHPSSSSSPPNPSHHPPNADRSGPSSGQHANNSGRGKHGGSLAPPPAGRGHRSSLSLGVPSTSSRARHRSDSSPWSTPHAPELRSPRNGHRRSLSIVSIGSATSVNTVDGYPPNSSSTSRSGCSHRPARGHARASSLQIMPRGGPISGPRSASHPHRNFNSQPSPLYNSSYPPDRNVHGRPSGAATVPNTPGIAPSRASPRLGPDVLSEWKFPTVQSPSSETNGWLPKSPIAGNHNNDLPGTPDTAGPTNIPIRTKEPPVPMINESDVTPTARVLSTTSIAGTPRSSGEFYSLSNNSTETLASEYVTHPPQRAHARPAHLRQRSHLAIQRSKAPEALMMGYAQIQGNFTLDGSLVNLAPFEHVKRKAVVGGQGGGVIGVEQTKRESGLLRGFGWGSLTSSIGDLLGGGELSTIKEMRGVASAKSVPLLSTPQSILFVDLQLAPGESKSFEYSFRLPKGLPPSHRGKAMKILYSLVIGTQRPGGAKEQRVKSVEIPFRVLGSVNSHGEILGHDLMSPYVLLRDQAQIQTIEQRTQHHETPQKRKPALTTVSTMNEFLSYAEELLNRGPGGGLLSPSAAPSSRRPSTFEEASTAREAIDLAIIRSNLAAEGQQSTNRFEIARNGRKVGVVMLARPAYRLGESVTLAIDFNGAEIPCYAVHAALETAEKIDPTFALRSEASVHRVTRKVYASSSEATLYSRRAIFNPTIPVTATPEFVTSGLSLEWKIRLEFVVPTQHDQQHDHHVEDNPHEEDGEDEERQPALCGPNSPSTAQPTGLHPLLEEVSRDDRGGLVLVAAENLVCESFEVAVPLRVYGAVTSGLERLDRDDASEEGLVV